jgi:hypothetical protein
MSATVHLPAKRMPTSASVQNKRSVRWLSRQREVQGNHLDSWSEGITGTTFRISSDTNTIHNLQKITRNEILYYRRLTEVIVGITPTLVTRIALGAVLKRFVTVTDIMEEVLLKIMNFELSDTSKKKTDNLILLCK